MKISVHTHFTSVNLWFIAPPRPSSEEQAGKCVESSITQPRIVDFAEILVGERYIQVWAPDNGRVPSTNIITI